MKIKIILTAAVMALSLTACTGTDNDTSVTEAVSSASEETEMPVAHVQGEGFSLDFDLNIWMDVTEQAAGMMDSTSADMSGAVFGWREDNHSSCTVASAELNGNSDDFDLKDIQYRLVEKALAHPGVSLDDEGIRSIDGQDWIYTEYTLSADVYGSEGKAVQYHIVRGTQQVTLSFSVIPESFEKMKPDMDAVVKSFKFE